MPKLKYSIVKINAPNAGICTNIPGFNMPFIPEPSDTNSNKLLDELRNLGVTAQGLPTGAEKDIKHIPELYLRNSRQVSLQLLAGFLDADGYYDEISDVFTFKQSVARHQRLFDDVLWLTRSLGFFCCIPYKSFARNPAGGPDVLRVTDRILGDLQQIPCLLPRKQARQRIRNRVPKTVTVSQHTRLPPALLCSKKGVEKADKEYC